MPDIFDKNNKDSQKGSPKEKTDISLELHKEIEKIKNNSGFGPLSSFCVYPQGVRFVNKDPEEKVIMLLRQHPITNLRWIVTSFLLLVAPAFFSLLELFQMIPEQFRFIGVLIWYLITIAFMFEQFLSWFFHVNIITDERIIEVDFINFLYREMTDANIDKIEDVTVEIGGAIRTFFDYGNVVIQTAAEVPRIDFEAVPNPDKVARILRVLRVEEEQEKLEGRVR